jgi:hypothetical protein
LTPSPNLASPASRRKSPSPPTNPPSPASPHSRLARTSATSPQGSRGRSGRSRIRRRGRQRADRHHHRLQGRRNPRRRRRISPFVLGDGPAAERFNTLLECLDSFAWAVLWHHREGFGRSEAQPGRGGAAMSRPLNLHFVSHTDDGDNLDLFVWSTTPQAAVSHWRAYYRAGDILPITIYRAPSPPGARLSSHRPGVGDVSHSTKKSWDASYWGLVAEKTIA